MKNGRCSILILTALWASTLSVFGQEAAVRATKDRLLSLIVLSLNDGSVVSGRLVGVESDSLVLRRKGRDERFPSESLTRIAFEAESLRTAGGLVGAIAVSYTSLALFRHAENQPVAFLERSGHGFSSTPWSTVIAAGAGAGLGFLLPIFTSDRAVFSFIGPDERRKEKWADFVGFVTGAFRPRRFSLSLQGGSVWGMDMVEAKKSAQAMGLEMSGSYYSPGRFEYQSWADARSVNMLRAVRANYSLSWRFQVGLAVYFAGQPAFAGSKYENHRRSGVFQTMDATALFVTGGYEPLAGRLGSRLRWEIVAGAGFLNYRLEAKDFAEIPSSWPPAVVSDSWSGSGISAAGLVSTALTYDLTANVTVGLTADYLWVPKTVERPILPAMGIDARTFRLGSGCIGWVLGLRI